MLKNFSNKLRLYIKRILGKSIYFWIFAKDFIKKSFKQKNKALKNIKLSSFLPNLLQKRKLGFLIFLGAIFLYYGIGTIVSSNINTNLNYKLSANNNSRYTTSALIHSLKTQVDDTQWTPALPIIFPAYFLDNLPNFQIGAKDSVKHFIKKMSSFYNDKDLKKASELLNYAPNIWLFSKTNDDTIAPGSVKQYRKALALLNNFANNQNLKHPLDLKELNLFLTSINSLFDKNLQQLDKQIREYSSDMFNHSSDNVFYNIKGSSFVVYYIIEGLIKDYQDQIVKDELYVDMTTILKNLKSVVEFTPITIKNSSIDDVYSANHLIYVAYFLSSAQNKLKDVIYTLEQKNKESF